MPGLLAFLLNGLVFSWDSLDWKGPLDLKIRFTSFGSEIADLGPGFVYPTPLLFNKGSLYAARDQSGFSVAM